MTLHLLDVLGRAGGGQGFGGGGGGYSGGGGGGGFSFGGGGLALAALFGGPSFFFFMLVMMALSRFMNRGASFGQSDRSGPSPAAVATTVADPGAGLAAITAHDPAFDLNNFLARVQRSFFLVQQAWMERKPEISRRVMADALWDQHRMQIQQYVERNQQNRMDQLTVGSETPIAASSDQAYDTITVRIMAASSDYDLDVGTGKVVRGDHAVRQWAEDWHFQRSAKAITLEDGGTMNDRCPNCGAPLQMDLAGVCTYCQSQVMSGEYDWVLARISQV